jgi:hypothetical protein
VPHFHDIAPYLTHPLTLIGYVLLLVFGVHRALLRSGLLSQQSQASSGSLLRLLVHYGFVIAVLLILAGFGLEVFKDAATSRPSIPLQSSPTNPESPFRTAARNNLSPNEVTCLNAPHERVPARTRVCVSMHGTWLGPWAGGVAPWDKTHPTTVWTQSFETNGVISTESRYVHPNEFQEQKDFYVCVRPPVGAAINAGDRMAIDVSVSTGPCGAPAMP